MKTYLLAIFALLVFASCETLVDVDIPREAPKLVVNTQLVPDSIIRLHLTQSRFILDNTEFRGVNNATITVLEEGNIIEQLQKTEEDGMYVSNFVVEEGKNYTLKAEAQGFTAVEASSYLAPKVPIQNIVLDSALEYSGNYCYDRDSCFDTYNIYYDVKLTLKDPANSPNYYSVMVYSKRTEYYIEEYPDGTTKEISYDYLQQLYLNSNDASVALADFDLSGEGAWGEEIMFSDEIFDGKTYTFNFEIDNGFSSTDENQELIFVLKHLSETQFKYQVSRELQNWNDGNPFAEPVQVYNNIKNGYGIFAGYSADSKTVVR